MEANEVTPNLNEQQLMMLRLFKTPMPDSSFTRIRKLAVELLADQLDETIEQWELKNGITESHYEELSKQHFRSSSKKG